MKGSAGNSDQCCRTGKRLWHGCFRPRTMVSSMVPVKGDTNWADFTDEIFRLAGKKTKVNHITTEEYVKNNPASANRPAYSILDNMMFRLTGEHRFADWHDAIEEYIKGM